MQYCRKTSEEIIASQEKEMSQYLQQCHTLAVFQGHILYTVCSKITVWSASSLSICAYLLFIYYQLMTKKGTATARNSCVITSYRKCLWTCMSLWVQRPTGQAQDLWCDAKHSQRAGELLCFWWNSWLSSHAEHY